MNEKPKKNSKGVPTPTSRSKIYTEQENRLLDQITNEIVEAWHKDLQKIKKTFEITEKTTVKLNEIYHAMMGRISLIDSFMDPTGKFKDLNKIIEIQEECSIYLSSLRVEVSNISTKLEYKQITETIDRLKKFDERMMLIENTNKNLEVIVIEIFSFLKTNILHIQQQKKWWQIWK